MQVGSLVECIFDFYSIQIDYDCPNRPIKGRIYTVSEITDSNDGVYIRLEEVTNLMGDDEPMFFIAGFRELMPPIENVEEWILENTVEHVECNTQFGLFYLYLPYIK